MSPENGDKTSEMKSQQHPNVLRISTGSRNAVAAATSNHKDQTNMKELQLPTSESSNGPKHGDTFVPGTLNMSQLQTYEKCFVDPCRYEHHLSNRVKCVNSDRYKLSYFMVGKAGSSTCRNIMGNHFGASEDRCYDRDGVKSNGFFRFTFVREPSERFIAAFQHTLTLSFKGNTRVKIPERHYKSFSEPFANMTVPSDFTKSLATKEGNRVAFQAMQQFLTEYDANYPLDGHMALQIPRFANSKTGRTRPLEAVYDKSSMDEQFQKLAEQVQAPPPQMVHAHERRHYIDTKNLTDQEKIHICKLFALDYCCLNYKLPEVCEGVVQCQWTKRPEFPNELLIESASQYPPVGQCAS